LFSNISKLNKKRLQAKLLEASGFHLLKFKNEFLI